MRFAIINVCEANISHLRKQIFHRKAISSDVVGFHCGRSPSRRGSEPIHRQSRCGGFSTLLAEQKSTPEVLLRVCFFGAGSGGRTRTVSLPPDFESGTSANSIIPANFHHSKIISQKNQLVNRFLKFLGSFFRY